MDEAFIGIIARVSRRVAPRATIQRALDVYLVVVQQHMHKAVLDEDAEEVWGKQLLAAKQFGKPHFFREKAVGTRIPPEVRESPGDTRTPPEKKKTQWNVSFF